MKKKIEHSKSQTKITKKNYAVKQTVIRINIERFSAYDKNIRVVFLFMIIHLTGKN